jgi:hypothetical protein
MQAVEGATRWAGLHVTVAPVRSVGPAVNQPAASLVILACGYGLRISRRLTGGTVRDDGVYARSFGHFMAERRYPCC